MNRSFKLVWCVAKGAWVVASELAKGKKKNSTHKKTSKVSSTKVLPCLLIVVCGGYASTSYGIEYINSDVSYNSPTEVLNDNILVIGNEAEGQLSLSNGATARFDQIFISDAYNGNLILTGDNTALTTDTMIAGYYNNINGYIQVLDGAKLSINSTYWEAATLGYNDGSNGTLLISGDNSSVIASGLIVGNNGGSGSVILSNGGTLKGNILYLGYETDSVGILNIGAEEGQTATAAGNLDLSAVYIEEYHSEIVLNHTDSDYVFKPEIDGYGEIKLLSGTTSFTGSLQNAYGTMTVDGGTLSIKAGNPQELAGSYTQTENGVLQLGVTSNTNYGSLYVFGTATFAENSKIVLDVADAPELTTGSTLTSVISAGTLKATTFAVTDNSALFDFSAVRNADNNNQVDLVVRQASNSNVSGFVQQQGFQSGMGAARQFDTFVGAGVTGTDMDNVVTALGQLSTGAEVTQAVAETLPLLQGGSSEVTADVMRTNNRIIQTRQAVRSGYASGDDFVTNKNVWLKSVGSWSNQGERKGISGYDADSYGVIGGLDGDLNDTASMGIAAAYIKSSIDGRGRQSHSSADIDSYQLAIYGQKALSAHDLNVDWQADVGYNRTDGQRNITFMGRRADSNFKSYTGHVGAGIGRNYNLSDTTVFIPSVRADYSYIYSEGYTEHGAGALNLDVDSNHVDAFVTSFEGRLEHQFNDRMTLTSMASVGYDLIDDDNSLVASYVGGGTTFTTDGLDQSPWIFAGGLGMNYAASDTLDVSVNYDLQGRSDYLNQTLSAKLKWAF